MRHIAARIGLIVIVLIVVLGGLGWGAFYAFNQHFYFDPPKADYPKPKTALEAQQQDVDYFRKLVSLDRSFSPAARAQANQQIDALVKLPAALPLPKLHVAMMQIMALADNGHSKMRIFDSLHVGPALPVRVTRFSDGFFVMRATKPYADMLGGRVESIDGVPFDQLLPKLETLRGGLEVFRRENAPLFIVLPELLYGLGITHDPHQATWTVRSPSGALVTHTLTAYQMPKEDPFPYGFRWTSPEPMKGMDGDWLSYSPASGTLPLSRQNLDRVFVRSAIPGTCAAYIRLQDIIDVDDQKIAPFLTDTEKALAAHPPCAVILDLRGNGGGDYTNAWHFGHALPGLVAPGGHVYVLTDPDTFSAAITTTAFVKETGGARTVIVGEPIGDRLAFYAEGGMGCLPNSHFCLTYETGKHDYGQACNDWHDCFWLNWFYPVRVTSLQPDYPVPQSFSDWNRGVDAAYERAVALANAQTKG